MNREPISSSTRKGVLIACSMIVMGHLWLQAGERVIFSNSNNSKIRIPKKELQDDTVTPNTEGFNRDHSSVDGVFAHWQNPMNSRSGVKQKERLLKALDRQKNWMLQDPEDLLSSNDFSSSEGDFDDVDFSSRESRYGTGSKNSFSRYYNRRENKNRFGTRRNQRRGSDYGDRSEDREDLEDEKSERPSDSFVTANYFSAKVDNIFDAPEEANEVADVQEKVVEEMIELPSAQASLSGIVDPFTELGIRPEQQQAQATASEFEKLLNTTVMDMTAGSQTGMEAGGIAAQMDIGGAGQGNPAAQAAILDGFRQTISSGLGTPSALEGALTGSAFESAVGAGRSSIFDGAPAQPTVMDRPAIFSLPTRSF